MNPYKLKAVVEFLRREGRSLGATHDELLSCFGLNEMLPTDEQMAVKQELAAIADAEIFMERLRLNVERWK